VTIRGRHPHAEERKLREYTLNSSDYADLPGRYGDENEALRAEVYAVHGRKTESNARVVKSEHGFHISTPHSMGTTLLPLKPRETKMSEPDAFGRVNRVYTDTGALVNNDNNTAAWEKTLDDARRHSY